MDRKLFVFDMDGTLLNSYRKINESSVKTLNEALDLNNDIVIATGRNLCQLHDEIALFNNKLKYVITINGGIVNDLVNQKTIILAKPLDKSVIQRFYEIAKHLKRELQWSNDKIFYRVYFGEDPVKEVDDPNFFYKNMQLPKYDDFEKVKDSLFNEPIFHLAIKCEKKFIHQYIDELKQMFEENNICVITETSKCYLDADPIGINKYNAIQKVQALLGYNNANTYCFGDSDNDLSMIKNVENGIAMENANENLKKVAKYVIGNNDSDAISNFVSNIISNYK